jgi:hypothetical protein
MQPLIFRGKRETFKTEAKIFTHTDILKFLLTHSLLAPFPSPSFVNYRYADTQSTVAEDG